MLHNREGRKRVSAYLSHIMNIFIKKKRRKKKPPIHSVSPQFLQTPLSFTQCSLVTINNKTPFPSYAYFTLPPSPRDRYKKLCCCAAVPLIIAFEQPPTVNIYLPKPCGWTNISAGPGKALPLPLPQKPFGDDLSGIYIYILMNYRFMIYT